MFPKEQKIIDRALKKFLPKDNSSLSSAMRYSVFAGGKRFRPVLMLLTAKLLNGRKEIVVPSACAIEMIHTFTLIHDDLPAMDNSDLRRGKPTCHKKFGEDIALLVGDALNTLAFEVIAKNTPPAKTARVIAELSSALLEVVEGQVLDIEAEAKKLSLSQLNKIHLKKTAALIRSSVKIAAILSRAKQKQINALTGYGEEMGLAFQIVDDILDFASTPEVLGKPTGADKTQQKSTYPQLLGIEKAKELACSHCETAVGYLRLFGEDARSLQEIANFAIRRLA